MLRFGFELEGFFRNGDEFPALPPKKYPTDGFPGLVELRSSGAKSLEDAYTEVIAQNLLYAGVDYDRSSGIFTPKQKAELRRRHQDKSAWDIRNLYLRDPRPLGNRTIASFQINISNRLRTAYTDDKGVRHADAFGLVDIPKIVYGLDIEFADEIKNAKRQPGEYCVKNDIRLEYRSLPNSVFSFEPIKARALLSRLNRVFDLQGE